MLTVASWVANNNRSLKLFYSIKSKLSRGTTERPSHSAPHWCRKVFPKRFPFFRYFFQFPSNCKQPIFRVVVVFRKGVCVFVRWWMGGLDKFATGFELPVCFNWAAGWRVLNGIFRSSIGNSIRNFIVLALCAHWHWLGLSRMGDEWDYPAVRDNSLVFHGKHKKHSGCWRVPTWGIFHRQSIPWYNLVNTIQNLANP